MKALLLTVYLCLLCPLAGRAESPGQELQMALTQKRWDQAVVLLQQADKGARDYYNLGLCYHHLSDPGRARAYYEASLKRNPWNGALHNNLALLKARFAEPEPEDTWLEAASRCAPPEIMALSAVFFSWSACALAWLYTYRRRERWLWSGVSCGAAALLTGVLWVLSIGQPERAVILPETAMLMNGPGNEFTQSITLHAGHCVEIHRREGDWVEVDVFNRVRAWVRSDQLLWIP